MGLPPPMTPTHAKVPNACLRSFFGMHLIVGLRCGGTGMIEAMPRIFATRSDGCAPTDIQYLMRSNFKRICRNERQTEWVS